MLDNARKTIVEFSRTTNSIDHSKIHTQQCAYYTVRQNKLHIGSKHNLFIDFQQQFLEKKNSTIL